MPILALENQEGTISWDGDPACFALRVRGDSMIGARIFDGDTVYIRRQDTVEQGQIAAVLIDGEADGVDLRNHYLYGERPFSIRDVRKWLADRPVYDVE
jgi:phage repressor protein C with HTH and peptisase S24 domain